MQIQKFITPEVLKKTTDYILNEGDYGNVITFNSPTPVACILPSDLRTGFNCTIVQEGVGVVTFVTPGTDDKVNGGVITPPTRGLWGWAKVLCLGLGSYSVDFGGGNEVGGASDIILTSQFGTKFSLSILEETDDNGLPLGTGSLQITKI
jgi:hypothetical protein